MNKKVVVHHFHEGNDADMRVRQGALYATQARVIDLDTGKTIENGEAWAYCSKKDMPSRANGRYIAVGRLIKHHPAAISGANFGVLDYLRLEHVF